MRGKAAFSEGGRGTIRSVGGSLFNGEKPHDKEKNELANSTVKAKNKQHEFSDFRAFVVCRLSFADAQLRRVFGHTHAHAPHPTAIT